MANLLMNWFVSPKRRGCPNEGVSGYFYSNPSKKERDIRALRTLERIRNDKTIASGEQNCWALGDVIIALSAPDEAFIYTIDHHFEVICQALGKKLFIEGN